MDLNKSEIEYLNAEHLNSITKDLKNPEEIKSMINDYLYGTECKTIERNNDFILTSHMLVQSALVAGIGWKEKRSYSEGDLENILNSIRISSFKHWEDKIIFLDYVIEIFEKYKKQ